MKSVFSFFFLLFLLLLAAAASASAGNTTRGWGQRSCTAGECIIGDEEGDGGPEVVRRILQQQNRLSYNVLQPQQFCNAQVYGNCIGSVNGQARSCDYFNRCKRG